MINIAQRIHPGKQAVHVQILRAVRGARVPTSRMVSLLQEIITAEEGRGAMQVVISGDSLMQKLNRKYRAKSQSTDVLSFPMADSPLGNGTDLIGEIYCNYDHCRRWQHEHGGKISDELLRLAAHGCLHLLGYDHHNRHDRAVMTQAENRYLKRQGLINERGERLS